MISIARFCRTALCILTRSNFNSPSVVISGFFGAGSLFEPDDKLGLAEYTSYTLMRGTKNAQL